MTENRPDKLSNRNQREKCLRVFVVDDSPLSVQTICSFLETQENVAVVGTASNGRQALERVEALRPDLVLMDIQMPEMNGLEVTVRLRRDFLTTRVVIVTVHDSPAVRFTARASGAHGFVDKNRLCQELPAEIQRLFP